MLTKKNMKIGRYKKIYEVILELKKIDAAFITDADFLHLKLVQMINVNYFFIKFNNKINESRQNNENENKRGRRKNPTWMG